MVASDDDPIRQAVLSAASRLLVEEGPSALANRRVAKAAGCSTMAIYTRFGSKGGVLEGLYLEGVGQLTGALRAVPPQPPRARVLALCLAYRRTALGFPGHYQLIFGQPVPGFAPSEPAREQARSTFGILLGAVAEAVEQGSLAGPPLERAYRLFALCHGLVSLELNGMAALLPDPEAIYRDAVDGSLVTP